MALDSYNRGYAEGVHVPGNKIGNYLISSDSSVLINPNGTRKDQDAGFYGIVYNYGSEIVISYRGTDGNLPAFLQEGLGSDTWNGYGVAFNSPLGNQAKLAIEFYNKVVPTTGGLNVSLTGHSLGGGLAGLIAGIYHRSATIFDNMPFEGAATAAYEYATKPDAQPVILPGGVVLDYGSSNASRDAFRRDVYGTTAPWQAVDFPTGSIRGYHVEGEFLQHARFLMGQQTRSYSYDLGPSVDLPGVDSGLFGDGVHSIATLVMLMFAGTTRDWHPAAQYFWPVLYDNSYALTVAQGNTSLIGPDPAADLRTIIAYSALDEGIMPFGNAGIRALFDDATDLGRALGASEALGERYGTLISRILIDYAGKLALNKITVTDLVADVHLKGVLAHSNAPGNKTLTVTFDDSVWKRTNPGGVSTVPTIVARKELVDTIINGVGFGGPDAGMALLIRQQMQSLWGDSSENIINHIAFATTPGGATTMLPSTMAGKVAMFVGTEGADTVTGTTGSDLIYGGRGDDRLIGGKGNDILLGGAGLDTADYSLDPARVTVTFTTGGGYTVKDGYGGEDRLLSVENLVLTKFDDVVNQGETSLLLTRMIDGGAGYDTLHTSVFDQATSTIYDAFGLQDIKIASFEEIDTDVVLVDQTHRGIIEPDGTSAEAHIFDWSKSSVSGLFWLGVYNPEYNDTVMIGSVRQEGDFNLREMHGTNNGDIITTGFFVQGVTFHTGTGNDIVYSHIGHGEPLYPNGISYVYTGGNDVFHFEDGKPKAIILGNGILVSDVSVSQSRNSETGILTDVLTVANRGVLTITSGQYDYNPLGAFRNDVIFDAAGGTISLFYFRRTVGLPSTWSTPEGLSYVITPGSRLLGPVEGTWDDDSWSDRSSQNVTYYGRGGNDRIDGKDGNNKLYGGVGNDTLIVADGDNHLYGGPDDDTIIVGTGANLIDGGDGNDTVSYAGLSQGITIDRSTGRITHGGKTSTLIGIESVIGTKFGDTDIGSTGNDTYVLSTGKDTIQDPGGNDAILLGPGVTLEQLSILKSGTDMVLVAKAGIDETTVKGQFAIDGANVIETMTFADGFTLNLADFAGWKFVSGNYNGDSNNTTGVNIADTIIGAAAAQVLNGYDLNDTIFAGGGNDSVLGGTGNDQLHGGSGNDALTGQQGADKIWGGTGDDTFTYAVGHSLIASPDVVIESASEGMDTIRFTGGILASALRMWTDESGSISVRYSATDQLVIRGGLDSKGQTTAGQLVERIVFDDGSITRLDTGLTMTDTDDAHTLNGSAVGDRLDGRGGGDHLAGHGGHDTLIGGTGVDFMAGGVGDDVYILKAGDSPSATPDTLTEREGEGSDTIWITGGILPADVTIKATTDGAITIQYSPGDLIILDYAYMKSGYIAFAPVWEKLIFDNGTVWDLTSLPISGTTAADSMGGSGSADALDGLAGNDTLHAYAGNDTLTGGAGQDALYGGTGGDTYWFRPGESPIATPDMVAESLDEGTDTIRIADGVLPNSVRMWTDSSYLYVQYTASDVIKVQAEADADGAVLTMVEKIVFDNATTWNLAGGLPLIDTDASHSIAGSRGNDTIDGRGGNDAISAFGGNDILTGGLGRDQLYGGLGNDSFVFRKGDSLTSAPDTVYEYVGEGVDTIRLSGGILPTEVKVTSSGSNLLIKYSTTDTLVIQAEDDAVNGGVTPGVERVVFDNGQVWDFRSGLTSVGSAAGETLSGSGLIDILNGNGGNDVLNGLGGKDTLNGGAGDDRLTGGEGSDRYIYGAGTDQGSDIISDTGGAGDMIELAAGYTASNITLSRVGLYDLAIKNGASQLFLIKNQFTDPSTAIEFLKYGDGTLLNLLSYKHTLNGTAAGNTLYGTSYGAGGDILNGLGGTDTIYAGAGNDVVSGGDANDTIYGEDGNDILNGDAGNDFINGGLGNDIIKYDGGADVFSDGGGIDTIDITIAGITAANMSLVKPIGYPSKLEVLLNGAHAFDIQGQFSVGRGFEIVRFADGSTFNLSQVKYTTNGTEAGEALYGIGSGGNPDDIINGYGGADTINGEAGKDTITGGTGNDFLYGGAGNDTYVYNVGDGFDTISDSAGIDVIRVGSGYTKADLTWARTNTYDLSLRLKGVLAIKIEGHFNEGYGVESVAFADGTNLALNALTITQNGTVGADTLEGFSVSHDILNGNAGNDWLSSYGGNDTLNGATGTDYLYGGSGNDIYVFKPGDSLVAAPDTVAEDQNAGNDTIKLTGGVLPSNVFMWIDGDLHIRYAAGNEIAVQGTTDGTGASIIGTYLEKIAFDNGTVWTLTGGLTMTDTNDTHTMIGSTLADTLNGAGGNDELYGYAGDDSLTGGLGSDYLMGGLGNDVYQWQAGHGADMVQDDGGADKVLIGGSTTLENLVFTISGWDLKVTSATTPTDNVLIHGQLTPGTPNGIVEALEFRDGFALSLAGYSGWIKGDTAPNTLNGDVGGVSRDDTILGASGNDVIRGLDGNDTISGDAGNDTLYGGAGNDALHGGSGNDFLYGETGSDTIYAGTGLDTLSGGANSDRFVFDGVTSGIDTIIDFSKAEDILDLTALLTGYDPTRAITDFLQITDSGVNSLVKVDPDGVGAAHSWAQIATLNNVIGMTDENALLGSGRIAV